MSEQRPFSAASNKYAYAQAFAGPTARRHSGHSKGRLHVPGVRRRTALRARDKTSA